MELTMHFSKKIQTSMQKLQKHKKADYFILDAIFASMLLLGGLMVISQFTGVEKYTTNIEFVSKDILTVFSALKISDLNATNRNNLFVVQEINNGNITNQDNTILEQIGEYWARGDNTKASTLAQSVLDDVNISYNIEIAVLNAYRTNSDTIYAKNVSNEKQDVVVYRRMISGIEKGEPVSGYSSSAYLKKISNKKKYAYAYFGGFVGQGNISVFINISEQLNTTAVSNVYLEGDFDQNFSLYINNARCSATVAQPLFIANTNAGVVDNWSLPNCTQYIQSGLNNFTILFASPSLDKQYISGGFLRVEYHSTEIQSNIPRGFDRYFFPDIRGVVNLYDSFYIPGTLQAMSIGLHFKSDQPTYLTVGDHRVDILNTTGADQWVYFNSSQLVNQYFFVYDQLSNNTVPLRLASYNATKEIVTGGNADIVVISDWSGSMKKSVYNWTDNGFAIGSIPDHCVDAYSRTDPRKTELASCLADDFVVSVMNYSGNRVWPVMIYHGNPGSSVTLDWLNNPENNDSILNFISTRPQGKGETCLACSINKAYEIFQNFSNSSRKKFIVLMTDGVPTNCAQGSCTSTSTLLGDRACDGLCDSGVCSPGDIATQCAACTANQSAVNNLIFSTNRVVSDFHPTIYTVGFGPVDDCPLCTSVMTNVATIGNGTYQSSNNVTKLRLIYANISQEILTKIEQSNQSVFVKNNITVSNLYGDSYINFTYIPNIPAVSPTKISLNAQVSLPSCNGNVSIPPGVEIVDSKVISYSGPHWSDLVVVNNVTAFNLSNYFLPYYQLGDPLVIHVPPSFLMNGTRNDIFIDTGDSQSNRTGCSPYNSFIYTVLIPAISTRSTVAGKKQGCLWNITYEDDSSSMLAIPENYNGTKRCSYAPNNWTYDTDDSYDTSVFALLTQLDFYKDGKVFVHLDSVDLEIVVTTVSSVPYMWGPSLVEVRVWR
jgi:hypothetical protein